MIYKVNTSDARKVNGYSAVSEVFKKHFGRIDEDGLFFGVEGTYIFTIKQKYDCDDDWEQITSIFKYSATDRYGNYDPTFEFEFDFYEGEDEVYVLGIKNIEDLEINGFDEDLFERHFKGVKCKKYELDEKYFEEVK